MLFAFNAKSWSEQKKAKTTTKKKKPVSDNTQKLVN